MKVKYRDELDVTDHEVFSEHDLMSWLLDYYKRGEGVRTLVVNDMQFDEMENWSKFYSVQHGPQEQYILRTPFGDIIVLPESLRDLN